MKNQICRALVVAALLPLGACDILDVESPGRIADSDLNTRDAVEGMVAYELSAGDEVRLANGWVRPNL